MKPRLTPAFCITGLGASANSGGGLGTSYLCNVPTISCTSADYFWRVVSTLGHFSKRQYNYDDQARVNYALKAMRIKWDKSDISIAASFGWTLKERLHVTALPTTQVCRTCKESGKSLYYIWHKRGQKDGESKIKTAEESGFWYLRNDWETVRTDARGALWLGQLALSTA